ncbi:MAG: amino acid adenylation domain-containing protein [Planctomycetota bacterium]
MTPVDILLRLQELDVEIWLEGRELRLSTAPDALPEDLRAALAQSEAQLIDFLRDAAAEEEAVEAPMLPIARDGPLALSFAQQRFWLLMQLGEDDSALHLRYLLRLRGPLDREALAASLEAIVRRHEILRTSFRLADGQPVQAVGEAPPQVLEWIDIDSTDDPWGTALDRADADFTAPFDLAAGLPLRFSVYRLGDRDHLLSLTLLHMVSDGWSYGVVFNELSRLYLNGGQPDGADLPELRVQFADYASWQRERYGERRDQLLAYWRDRLADAGTLELPTDRPRPPQQSTAGRRQSFPLDPAVSDRLAELSRREGCTHFMTMLAAFNVLLARYSGQDDIVIGTPVANREHPDTGTMIGPLLNTLVLRTDLSGAPTFRELLRRVREVALGAFEHQDMPFEELVVELRPERDLSRSPVFQVLFNVLYETGTPPLGDLDVELVEPDVVTSLLDLSLILSRVGGTFEYRTDLFDDATIARMARHFQTLMQAIAEDPDRSVWELAMLSDVERDELVHAHNQTAHDYPRESRLQELFEARVAAHPDGIAVRWSGDATGEAVTVTAAELNRRANQLAHHLSGLGATRGSLVGVALHRSLDAVTAVMAILKAGAAYLPLDPSYPARRLELMLRDSKVALIVTDPRAREALPETLPPVVDLETDAAAIASAGTDNPTTSGSPDDPAYVIYTSGSTGAPKGVVGLHRGAVNRLHWMWATAPFGADEVCCQKTALSFVDSVCEILSPVLAGVPLVVIPDDAVVDTPRFIAALEEHRVSRLVLVPSLLRAMLEQEAKLGARLPLLRHWVCSGEALPTELAHRFAAACPGSTLLNLYGFSEATADVTSFDATAEPGDGPGVPIGRPIWNTRIYLLDPRGQLAPPGVPGEICVGGDGLARGYLHRAELTAERFIADPFGASDDRLYRSGDLGRWRPDGALVYEGRRDQQEKVRGFRIELGEIEHALAEHDAVGSCAVVTQARSSGDKQITAYVVLPPGEQATVSELRRHLRDRLPDYMVPGAFVFPEALPLLPNGKIDRRALAHESAQAGARDSHVPPATPTEEVVARIWSEALGTDRVGRNDNFIAIGGHSLLAVKVISRLEEDLGPRLQLMDLLAETLAQVAARCDRATGGQAAVAEPTASPGDGVESEAPATGLFSRLRRRLRGT